MSKESKTQLARVNDFIDSLEQKEDSEGIILLDSEMECLGATDPLGKQNGKNCKNSVQGSCNTNGGDCANTGSACVGSENSGSCQNFPDPIVIVGLNCQSPCVS